MKSSGPDQNKAWPRASQQSPQPLRLVPASTAERRLALENFIRARFAERYGANVRHFMPCLLALESPDGALHGAIGCRQASEEPLFLERYLANGIEHVIRERCGADVPREAIVEVGNLATRGSASSRFLIVELTRVLLSQRFRWVAFTGTASLLNSFGRLGLTPVPIGPADPARLGDERGDWGSYYDNRPQVMVGEIRSGHRRLTERGVDVFAVAPPASHLVRTRRSPIVKTSYALCR